MPFGRTNVTATFQRTMDQMFDTSANMFRSTSKTWLSFSSLDQHLKHLEDSFFIPHVKVSKFSVGQSEIEFVGYIFGQNGIRPIHEKLQVFNNWPKPSTVEHISSFWGVCGFNHRFVPAFATFAAPLTAILHKTKRWTWSTKEQKSFDDMKNKLLQHVVRYYPTQENHICCTQMPSKPARGRCWSDFMPPIPLCPATRSETRTARISLHFAATMSKTLIRCEEHHLRFVTDYYYSHTYSTPFHLYRDRARRTCTTHSPTSQTYSR